MWQNENVLDASRSCFKKETRRPRFEKDVGSNSSCCPEYSSKTITKKRVIIKHEASFKLKVTY